MSDTKKQLVRNIKRLMDQDKFRDPRLRDALLVTVYKDFHEIYRDMVLRYIIDYFAGKNVSAVDDFVDSIFDWPNSERGYK